MRVAILVVAAACSSKKAEAPIVSTTPKDALPRDAGPTPIQHVEQCPGARATWTGEREDEHDFYSTLTVTADGAPKPLAIDLENIPSGNWSFQIFSPDCQRVLLLLSSLGPFHIVRVDHLARYLAGEPPEFVLQGKSQDPEIGAGNHRDGRWASNTEVTWAWGCCDPPVYERFVIPHK